ncbi:MAG: hypothetical protein ACXQTP_05120 [Candidatus Methanofastidiosia archaeon]
MTNEDGIEKKIATIGLLIVGIGVIAYSYKFQFSSNRAYVALLYAPLIAYALLCLTPKVRESYLATFNYALMAVYSISFLETIFRKSLKMTSYGLLVFIIPVILLAYIATENTIDQKQFVRTFSAVIVFFLVSMFLPYNWYLVAFVGLNAAILTYFLFDFVTE